MNEPCRADVAASRRIIVKVGTRVLTRDDGRLAMAVLFGLAESAGDLARQGRDVLLVSSGAVGLGAEALGFEATPTELADRQACAAVGQARLMTLYQEGFAQLGLRCAQVLLTQSDFGERRRYLNLRATLEGLLARGVVPVINENDAVSTEELALYSESGQRVFGDNDRLSALVAAKLEADLLILLTDVDGVYEADPRHQPGAGMISRLDASSAAAVGGGESGSTAGRGGMRAKLEAAEIASRSGCHAVVASGRQPGIVGAVVAGEPVGTWIPAGERLAARERWIAWAAKPRGRLRLDAGAVAALVERGASLLAAGVTRVEGRYRRGDVVDLVAPDGARIGRGVAHCGSDAARAKMELPPGERQGNECILVRRDQMVLSRRRRSGGETDRATRPARGERA